MSRKSAETLAISSDANYCRRLIDWAQRCIGPLTDEEADLVTSLGSAFLDGVTTEIPPADLNAIHSRTKQKLLGIAYTPEPIRRELTSTVLSVLGRTRTPSELRICDPCCGSGLFVISYVNYLSQQGIHPQRALTENVFFRDIDRLSVCTALANIFAYGTRFRWGIDDVQPNVAVQDLFDSSDLFDAYITNPPYVKLQNLAIEEREKLRALYPALFVGALGLSSLFMKRMFDTLTDDGTLGVITQNNFFTSNAAKLLRKEIESHVFRIDTFGSNAIFPSVSTYTCLFYLTKSRHTHFEYRRIRDQLGFLADPSRVRNSSLHHSKWRLGSPEELSDIKTLESRGTPLRVACRIWVGIATQFDKAFTVERVNDVWLSRDGDGRETIVEDAAVKPLIKVADLTDPDSVRDSKRGVIYPYVIRGESVTCLDEPEFSRRFPGAYAALSAWRRELLGREKGSVKKGDWYKWGRIQSMIPVSGKLLTKTFNRGPCFYFDESASLFSNGYAVKVVDARFDLRFVQSVLNSRVFDYYARLTSFEIEGDYQCFQKNFIERFCLPDISIEMQLELVKHPDRMVDFLASYYELSSAFQAF